MTRNIDADELEIGHTYQTRSGKKALITSKKNNGRFLGAICDHIGSVEWFRDGTYTIYDKLHPFDLIAYWQPTPPISSVDGDLISRAAVIQWLEIRILTKFGGHMEETLKAMKEAINSLPSVQPTSQGDAKPTEPTLEQVIDALDAWEYPMRKSQAVEIFKRFLAEINDRDEVMQKIIMQVAELRMKAAEINELKGGR